MLVLSDLATSPDKAPHDPESRLVQALAERRPASCLALVDLLGDRLSPADLRAVMRCIWAQAGSIRGLAGVAPTPGEPGPVGHAAIAATPARIDEAQQRGYFDEQDLPRVDADSLVLVRDSAANAGRAAELVRSHLALAETADRVDARVGHVEAAQAIALALDDRALTALVEVFLARLDADFGEAEDAVDRAAGVLELVAPDEAPRATTLALLVRAVVLGRAPVPTPSGTAPEADPAVHVADALLPSMLQGLGWSAGYPGPAWGLGEVAVDDAGG